MAMIKFKAPALPVTPTEYNQGQQEQLNRALRLYFNQLDSTTPLQAEYFLAQQANGDTGYFQGRGDKLLQPYAMLVSSIDQVNAGITSENLIKYDAPTLTNGITIVSDSQIHVPYPGQYLVTFSLQVTNRGTTAAEFEVWAKTGTTNYPLSNTRFDIPGRKSSTIWAHVVPAVSGILTVNDITTDYLQLAWWSDSLDVYLEHYAAGTTPTRPAIPSVILTINLISAIP
jgi:hypothetical protein